MGFLSWLENTSMARWVVESLVAYPAILSLHGIGMAFLVGTLLMYNIRILGFASGLPITAFNDFMKVAIIGLIVNTITGLLLFAPDANRFLVSVPFITKIACIIIGLVLVMVFRRKYLPHIDSWPGGVAPPPVKVLAGLSVIAWLGAIIAGRLIAYF